MGSASPTKALHATLAVVIDGHEEATNKGTWRNLGQNDAARLTGLHPLRGRADRIFLDTAAKTDGEHEPFLGDEDDFDAYNDEDEDPNAA